MGMQHGAIREVPMTLLGQTSLDPYYGTTSAARGAMMNTHVGQAPIVDDNEPRRTFTGAELLYGEKTFDIRFPVAAQVLKIVRKYPVGMGGDTIRKNPVTTIIYEDYYDEFKRIGVLHVPEFNSLHQDFGYRFQRNTDVWEQMIEGAMFEKDTVIAASTAVKKDGRYGLGLNASVAFMSHPGTIEDGFVMSESFARRLSPKIYNTAIANCGRKTFLLNLYGDEFTYKPFPDIGDKIRDDGVIFAHRDLDDDLAPADMTPRALRTIDRSFDRPVIGKPGARVVDITVYHDNRTNPQATPFGMGVQMKKYYDANCAYYREIMKFYTSTVGRRGKMMRMMPEFNQLVLEAQVYLPTPDNERKLTRMYRLETLDEWRIEVTYEANMEPSEGYKATDMHGGKGVNCRTVPDDWMPIDQNGNRAEVLIYGASTNRRSNFGRLYEHFTNACSRDLLCRLRAQCGMATHTKPTSHQLAALRQQPELVSVVFETLMRYFKVVAPLQYDLLKEDDNEEGRFRYVTATLKDGDFKRPGIDLWVPPDNPVNLLDMTRHLIKSEFCPHYGPVTYRDSMGKQVTTVNPVLIADMYMIMLEKIGEDWSGVASVKTQHFGLPAKVTSADKSSTPGREQPVRSMGESETRSAICTIGPGATNELLDQTHNPASHRFAVENILTAKKPTDIDLIVDRRKVPYGGSRSVALVQHLLECRGLRFKYKADAPHTFTPGGNA